MKCGQVVISKQGRDKGLAMVVLEAQGEYLQLADGKTRSLHKPKKKKVKHVQPTNHFINLTPSCGRELQDADIQKQLRVFREGGMQHCLKTM
jgi:ribosomal protein L14E/L6E/L27E